MRRRRAVALALVAALMAWAGVSVARDSAPSHAAKAQASLQLGVAHPAEHYPPIGIKPIIFLVLGDSTGRTVEESRISDSIHLIGYNPQLDRATILGFPRDLWIPIPGHGTTKINAATQYGGPQLMIQTIEDLTGIHINYYAEVGFTPFRTIINDLGGVVVNVPYPITDSHTRLHVKKGKVDMSGKTALEFSRSRYGVPNGDFSRSENQGIVLLSLLTKLHKQFSADPRTVLDWIGAGLRNTQNSIPLDQLIALALAAGQLPPKNVNNLIVPGSVDNVGGISIVRMSSTANALFKDMAKDGLVGKK